MTTYGLTIETISAIRLLLTLGAHHDALMNALKATYEANLKSFSKVECE